MGERLAEASFQKQLSSSTFQFGLGKNMNNHISLVFFDVVVT
jgi:hypothetical protein